MCQVMMSTPESVVSAVSPIMPHPRLSAQQPTAVIGNVKLTQSSESLLRVDMKVVLTWASKRHPGCTGVHQEKGRKLCHCWQLHERETLCGKRQAPLIGLEKTVANMAGKPSKMMSTSNKLSKEVKGL